MSENYSVAFLSEGFFKLLLTVWRKTNPTETEVNEINRFTHSLIKEIVSDLLSTCCMTGSVLGGAGGRIMGS